MEALIIAEFIFSVLSFIISVIVLLYLRHAVKKEHDHVRKLMRAILNLKTHLQNQMENLFKKRAA